MRESIVVELFAHDREDLAWQAADAPQEAIERILRAWRASDRPMLSRLASAAVEVLTGEPASSEMRRIRSPALEMPPELRYRAHRNETRASLVFALPRVRHAAGAWGWLTMTAFETPLYVQFSSYPGPGLRVEAVGNGHLPDELRIDEAAAGRLRELGWCETDPASDGNWSRTYPPIAAAATADYERIAEDALAAMEQGFGRGAGTQYRLEPGSWPDESMP